MIDITLIRFLNDIKLKINDIENKLYVQDNIRTNTIYMCDNNISLTDSKSKKNSLNEKQRLTSSKIFIK